ncbi:MAG: PTS sugar transporter subunit IIA [Candidatus Aureabacteria bacterium]|nr:PTS sugar transporter subunit IIA [Candidatus Auribacterota bacterium]
MLFSSIINKKLINIDLKSRTREDALRELILPLKDLGYDADIEKMFKMVMEREAVATTYTGKGVAIPHARIEGLKDFYVLIGRSAKGVNYVEETGEKANLIFMVLSEKTKNRIMLQALSSIAKLMKNDKVKKDILSVRTAAGMIEIIEKTNIKLKEALTNSDIMEPPSITLSPDMTIKEAVIVFFKHNVMCLPVVDSDNNLLGEIHESDIVGIGLPKYMNLLSNLSFLKDFEPFEEFFKKEDVIKVGNVFSKKSHAVAPDSSIVEAAFILAAKKTERVFVVDSGKLLGSITARDIIIKILQI